MRKEEIVLATRTMGFCISCFVWVSEMRASGNNTYGYRENRASQMALAVKDPPANAGDNNRRASDPWIGKIPWSRKWQPTSVLLPGESHGWRSLAAYSPWGHKELDMTECTRIRRENNPS